METERETAIFNILCTTRAILIARPAFFAFGFGARHDLLADDATPSVVVKYEVQPSDCVSNLYFRIGVGESESPFRLYGKSGWIAKFYTFNPTLSPKSKLHAGMHILLPVPTSLRDKLLRALQHFTVERDDDQVASDKAEEERRRIAKARQEEKDVQRAAEEERKLAAVKKEPEKFDLETLTNLPPDARGQVPAEVIKNKLDDDTVAKLDAETAEKIPAEVKVEKAWESSFWDSFKPGMDKLFGDVAASGPAVYAGVRYGFALGSNDFLGKARILGVIVEGRRGWMDGLRLIFDKMPPVQGTIGDAAVELSFQKLLAGWAIPIDGAWFIDKFHVVPRIGQYSVAGTLPILATESGEILTSDIRVDRAPSLGLEGDAEVMTFFYILRGWAGFDRSLAVAQADQVETRRFGVDAFLKGQGMGGVSLYYLAFIAQEQIALTKVEDGDTRFRTNLNLTYTGLGLSASW